MDFESLARTTGTIVDAGGVLVIVAGAVGGTGLFGYRLVKGRGFTPSYRSYRQGLGRAILLGLELLVAGDIIRTVAVSPTFRSVGVLAAIVLIRTFLSFSLAVELDGRWPWQSRGARQPDGG